MMASSQSIGEKHIDPVCGMTVSTTTAHDQTCVDGEVYYFCSKRCLDKFLATPGRYQKNDYPDEPQPDEATACTINRVYTCPMHPQVRKESIGDCPICGMMLESVDGSLDNDQAANYQDIRKRFLISSVLTTPLLFVSMFSMHFNNNAHTGHAPNFYNWLQLILATPVVLWAGSPLFVRAFISIRTMKLNMFTLTALGITVTFVYSVIAVSAPALFPLVTLQNAGGPDVYFETAAAITTLVLMGQILELKARARTNSALHSLLKLTPATARRIFSDELESDVSADSIAIGDRIRIRPGERIPIDGTVLEGQSLVDESMITGESLPVRKEMNDSVFCGTLNGTGGLVIKATKDAGNTLLSRIIRMVNEAQRTRAPIQQLADTVSAYFAPAVILVSIITFGLWYCFGPEPVIAHAVMNSVAVLIIACPCALGLATPTSITVAMGLAAKRSILIRDAEALETLERIDTLVVDKTGTLTEGKPQVVYIETNPPHSDHDMIQLAASLERGSEHPLAQAIVEAAIRREIELKPVTDFRSISGKGIQGKVGAFRVLAGNEQLINDPTLIKSAEPLRANGQTVLFVSVNEDPWGLLAVADPVKATTENAIKSFRKANLRIIMLTGDDKITAEGIGKKLLIEDIRARVLPQDKHKIIKDLQREGHIVAMAGDGINDSPALAQAHVGIAMGTGTDIAIENAGITLIKGDLNGIAYARRLSEATMQNIRQNLFFAFG